jgi:hypothetical protein
MFADHQPQVQIESLWTVLARSDLPAGRSTHRSKIWFR